MQYTTFLLSLLLSITGHLVSQTAAPPSVYGKIVYANLLDTAGFKARMEKMRLEKPDQYALVGADIEAEFDLAQSMMSMLEFSNETSISYVQEDLKAKEEDGFHYYGAKGLLPGNGMNTYYLNLQDSTKIYQKSSALSTEIVHIVEEWDKYKWEIQDETKQVGNYLCRKAVSTQSKETYCCGTKTIHITAWFAPALSFPFGPMGFDGLPGLVLEVNMRSREGAGNTLYAKEILIEPNSKKKIPKLHKPIRVTTEEELDKEAAEQIKAIRGGK